MVEAPAAAEYPQRRLLARLLKPTPVTRENVTHDESDDMTVTQARKKLQGAVTRTIHIVGGTVGWCPTPTRHAPHGGGAVPHQGTSARRSATARRVNAKQKHRRRIHPPASSRPSLT